MKRTLPALAMMLVACSAAPAPATTTTEPTTTTTVISTSSTIELRPCPSAPYEIHYLPPLTQDPEFDPSEVEPDVWTSIGGSYTSFIGRPDGSVAIALIRGTLPARDWPGQKGIVQIDGVDAAVGPHPDGTWVVGWYLEPAERCDLYTMVFYPPWSPAEVEKVLESMERIPG